MAQITGINIFFFPRLIVRYFLYVELLSLDFVVASEASGCPARMSWGVLGYNSQSKEIQKVKKKI